MTCRASANVSISMQMESVFYHEIATKQLRSIMLISLMLVTVGLFQLTYVHFASRIKFVQAVSLTAYKTKSTVSWHDSNWEI